ncbi:excalibur calcium-binding domain-containing protein [Streptomyces xanthophaeus]|nr:excalibur calcium-binding domain-containing protein [Streptomyces xanthophaeus]
MQRRPRGWSSADPPWRCGYGSHLDRDGDGIACE